MAGIKDFIDALFVMQKNLPVISDAVEAINKLGEGALKAASDFLEINDANQKLIFGLNTQRKLNDDINAQVQTYLNSTLALEKTNKSINKTFGVNVKTAAQLSQQFAQSAYALGMSHKSAIAMGETIKKNIVPFVNMQNVASNKYYNSLLSTQKILTQNLGLSEETVTSITGWAAQSGKETNVQLYNTTQLIDEMQKYTKLQISSKDVYEEIADAGAEIQMQFGRLPGRLELAAVKAKSLGLSLKDLKQTGENLLNIESSIGQELEYQLLSGRRLVDQSSGKSLTNTIREATLRGDMSAQADAMNKILEQEGDVLETNLYARQQMASLLQMDEASLSRAMQKKKLLEGAGAEILFTLQGDELAKAAKAMVRSNELSEEQYQELLDLEDTRTTDSLMKEQNAIAENIRELNLLQYTQGEISNKLQMAALGSNADIQKKLVNLGDAQLTTLGELVSPLQKAAILKTAFTNMIDIGTYGKDRTVNGTPDVDIETYDAIIPPGLGGVISLPAGTIGFQQNDGIAVGTNIKPATSNGSNDMMAFAMAIVNAINNQTNQLKRDPLFGSAAGNQPLYGET